MGPDSRTMKPPTRSAGLVSPANPPDNACDPGGGMASRDKGAPKDAEKILRCGVDQDPARYLYYVDKKGNVVRMERGVPKAKFRSRPRSSLGRPPCATASFAIASEFGA